MKKLLLLLSFALFPLLFLQAQVTNYNRWMAFLEDDAFICQLSIPGAHDACASSFTGWSVIGAAVAGKVQTMSVQQMLPLGVRLFDLRPNNQLNIHHGILQTSSTFSGIMEQLRDYVISNPTEFCVVLIRHESEGDSGNDSFADKMQQCLANFADYLVDFRPNLTVGEARGKILFLSRDDYNGPIRGGKVTDWRDNQSDINNMLGAHCYGLGTYKCPLWSQGYYEYSDVNAKKNVIRAMLDKSWQLSGKYNYTWVINGLDGYTGTYTNSATQTNAKTVNPYMQQLLASGSYNGPAGLVFMDYCCDGDNDGYYGLSLTKELINHNFRYTMSKQGDTIYDSSGNLFVAPRGFDMMWEGKFLRKEGASASGPSGWYKVDFDDSAWETKRFPTASAGTDAPYYSQWDGTNNNIFIRREFYIDHDPTNDRYKFYARHDDDYKVYLNGRQLDTQTGWISDYRVVNIASSRLNIGRNVLAIQVTQNSGGAFFDCGVLRTEATSASLKLTNDLWHNFVELGHNVDFSNTDVKAYKVVDFTDGSLPYVKVEEVSIVPAGEAVIVRSEKGAGTYNIPITQASASMNDNLLKATTASLSVTEDNTIYCIDTQNGKSCFFPQKSGTSVAKGKGYLDMSGTGTNASCIYIDRDDAMGIGSLTPTISKREGVVYNLAGQMVNAKSLPLKGREGAGIYIVDGKLVVIK